jgi:hypothetical protein
MWNTLGRSFWTWMEIRRRGLPTAETDVKHIGWNSLNPLRKTRDYRVRQRSFAITLEATVPRQQWIVEFACRILKTLGELKEPWTP